MPDARLEYPAATSAVQNGITSRGAFGEFNLSREGPQRPQVAFGPSAKERSAQLCDSTDYPMLVKRFVNSSMLLYDDHGEGPAQGGIPQEGPHLFQMAGGAKIGTEYHVQEGGTMVENRGDGVRGGIAGRFRVGLAILGLLLLLGGILGLIFGGCHSAGGLCAAEFQDDHAGALAAGLIGTAIGSALLARSLSRRRDAVVGALVVAVAVGGLVVVRSLP